MHAHTLEIVLLTFEELAQGLDTRLQLFRGLIHVAPLPLRGIVETSSTALHAAAWPPRWCGYVRRVHGGRAQERVRRPRSGPGSAAWRQGIGLALLDVSKEGLFPLAGPPRHECGHPQAHRRTQGQFAAQHRLVDLGRKGHHQTATVNFHTSPEGVKGKSGRASRADSFQRTGRTIHECTLAASQTSKPKRLSTLARVGKGRPTTVE